MRPAIWSVTPARSFDTAKSRLSPQMNGVQRIELARRCLQHLLGVLHTAPDVDGVVLATDDDEVAALAAADDLVRWDGPGEGLADIVSGGVETAWAAGADAVLVIMADLPLATTADIAALVSRWSPDSVVIAPDHAGRHTNALLVGRDVPFEMAFGSADSLARHRASARAAAARVTCVARPGLCRDVDRWSDVTRRVSLWLASDDR